MNATTAYFSNIESRPVSSKLVSVLRVLADRYEVKTLEKSKAKRKPAEHRSVTARTAIQPNLAAELRFVAWSA
jgi:hypothetical protein